MKKSIEFDLQKRMVTLAETGRVPQIIFEYAWSFIDALPSYLCSGIVVAIGERDVLYVSASDGTDASVGMNFKVGADDCIDVSWYVDGIAEFTECTEFILSDEDLDRVKKAFVLDLVNILPPDARAAQLDIINNESQPYDAYPYVQ